jgi:signal transduction histidine kinase/CheY-like chemotaxis protein
MSSSVRVESDVQARSDASEIRQVIIERLAVAVILGAGLAWTTVGAWGRFDNNRFVVYLACLLVGGALFLVNRYVRWLTHVVLLLGSSGCLALALIRLDDPLVPAFAALMVVANTVASAPLGLLASALGSGILYWLGPRDTLWTALALMWAAAVIQWALTQGLYTALLWASRSQQQAAELLSAVRERRGELRRTLDSLTEATRRLERTRYELAVARQQAEEARHVKSQFAANISHELRTPINLIMGFSEMMYRTPEVYGDVRWTPALRADIREIHTSARHLLGMVNDILDLARVEADRLPLRLEETRMRMVVLEAVETLQGMVRDRPVRLVTNVAPDLPTVLVDRARIRQVLINLINNAIRFTDQGSITVHAEAAGNEMVVSVTDTGVGIPADQLDVIFEQFGQAKGPITSGRGGVGLGLAICQQFVRLHGGQITAESVEGQGSVFRFTLPMVGAEQAGASRLAYYAPEDWSPTVPENPMGKTALLLTPREGAGVELARNIQGYRTLPVSELAQLEALIESEHPAGIVVVEEPFADKALAPEAVWQAAGRGDLPLLRCELPSNALAPEAHQIAAHLVKPVQADDLLTVVRTRCPEARSFLVVDDDPGFVALMDRVICAAYPQARLLKAYSGEEALELLAQERFDVLLQDFVLPHMNGLELLRRARALGQIEDTCVVLVTGATFAEETARMRPARVELLKQGGHAELGRYLSALLDVSPPNYARPLAPAAPPPIPVAEPPAL